MREAAAVFRSPRSDLLHKAMIRCCVYLFIGVLLALAAAYLPDPAVLSGLVPGAAVEGRPFLSSLFAMLFPHVLALLFGAAGLGRIFAPVVCASYGFLSGYRIAASVIASSGAALRVRLFVPCLSCLLLLPTLLLISALAVISSAGERDARLSGGELFPSSILLLTLSAVFAAGILVLNERW